MRQSPATEFGIVGREGHAVLVHVPVVTQDPALHVDERVPENPELQIGVQRVPVAEFTTQSPGPALAIAGTVAQAVLVQVPVVDQDPVEHVALRVPE
jgi:hypothetical protein